jgi:hypothetical protein
LPTHPPKPQPVEHLVANREVGCFDNHVVSRTKQRGLKMTDSMRGKRPARHAQPRAFYDDDLANWESASLAAELVGATQKHREWAGRIIAELITRLEAELVLEQEVRVLMKKLSVRDAGAIASLNGETAVSEYLWRRLKLGLMRSNTNRCGSSSDVGRGQDLEADRVADALSRRSVQDFFASKRAQEVVAYALEISCEPLPRGNVPSILEPTLVELGFVFRDAGGETTKGADGKSTKFDRWSFTLIEEAYGAVGRSACTLAEIVNITRNMKEERQPRRGLM